MDNLGTKENPVTHWSQGGAQHKYCKCAECGVVRKCTPSFDFYNSAYRSDDGLVCENCQNSFMHNQAATVRDITPTEMPRISAPTWVRSVKPKGERDGE